MKTVIAIAGKPGARTRELSSKLSEALGVSPLKFGEFVRQLEKGNTTNLQNAGQRHLEKMGPTKFLDAFLDRFDKSGNELLVIDGLRHVSIWNAIHVKYPRSFLVCIDLPDAQLIKRLMQHCKIGRSEAVSRLAHPVESEFPELLCLASLVLNAKNQKVLLKEIHRHLTCCLYHVWDEEDIIAKLHSLNETVNTSRYTPSAPQTKGFYELLSDALLYIPFEHHEAAYAIFANVTYLTNKLMSDVDEYLAYQVSAYVRDLGFTVSEDVYVFDIDHSNLAERLFTLWGADGNLSAMKYNKTPAHLLSNLTSLKGEAYGTLVQLLSKKVWILACDNVFSGESLIEELKILNSIIKICPGVPEPGPRILVCTQLFTQQAELKLASHKGKDFESLFFGLRFDDTCRVSSEQCKLFKSRDTLAKVKKLCEWFAGVHFGSLPSNDTFHAELTKNKSHGDSLYAYGWHDGGYLVVRQTNSPNNSIPVLWWPQKERKRSYKTIADSNNSADSPQLLFSKELFEIKAKTSEENMRRGYQPLFPREPSFAAYDKHNVSSLLAKLKSQSKS